MAKKTIVEIPSLDITSEQIEQTIVEQSVDEQSVDEQTINLDPIQETITDFSDVTIRTHYLLAQFSPKNSIKVENSEDNFKHPNVINSVLSRIVVFPNEIVYIPIFVYEELPSDYNLEIFKRISGQFELVSDKLVSNCVVLKSISDTPRVIVSESVVAKLRSK